MDKPIKYDQGKPRIDLIRPEVLLGLGEALSYGASKYNEERGDTPNYLKSEGFHYSKIYASLQRHLLEWYSGTNIDKESGIHHLKLAMANIHFLLTYELNNVGIDDRCALIKEEIE